MTTFIKDFGKVTTDMWDSTASTRSAGFHNSIFRGENLGTEVTQDQYDQISAGTFDDMFIGDYWLINSVKWRIAAFDYWLNHGDTACEAHHVVIVPDGVLASGPMNSTNVTTGAYVGSNFYTGANSNTCRATALAAITSAFGSGHLLSHREYLKNAVSNGFESGGSWYDAVAELMTEQNVYGCKVFGNVINGTNIPASYTIDTAQFPLFALAHEFICNRSGWWLRDVVSSTAFALVDSNGNCDGDAASNSLGIRPAFGIRA